MKEGYSISNTYTFSGSFELHSGNTHSHLTYQGEAGEAKHATLWRGHGV